MEHVLNQYFHDYLLKRDSLFLNTFFSWKFKLQQTIAEVNQKSFRFLNTGYNLEEPFYPKTKTLHGLTELPEVANQTQPLITSKDLEAIERRVNEYYWEFADCWQAPFSAEQVFAYMIKLIRLYHFKGFSAKGKVAKSNFEELVAEIKEKESSPKMPVI